MTPYEIPLTPEAQTFQIDLGGTNYQLTLYWCPFQTPRWMLNVATQLGEPIVMGIPVVTGLDLLAPYPHLGFAGNLMVQTDGDPDVIPTIDNLGVNGRLYFVVP